MAAGTSCVDRCVLASRSEIEALLGCEIVLGARAGLVFPANYLAAENPKRLDPTQAHAAKDEPIGEDFATCVAHLIELQLDGTRPTIDGIAGRLGLSLPQDAAAPLGGDR